MGSESAEGLRLPIWTDRLASTVRSDRQIIPRRIWEQQEEGGRLSFSNKKRRFFLLQRFSRPWEDSKLYRESFLVQLCRDGKWEEVIQRCITHPEEARPERLDDSGSDKSQLQAAKRFKASQLCLNKRKESRNTDGLGDPKNIFYKTALGIACAVEDRKTNSSDHFLGSVRALIKACPEQVGCSQHTLGHTPLRDAVQNPNCSVAILKMLLEADSKTHCGALTQKDSDGLYPMDHLLMGIQLGFPGHALESLKLLSEQISSLPPPSITTECCSPLIRLLSMGTACNLIDRKTTLIVSEGSNHSDGSNQSPCLKRVYQGVEILLNSNPGLNRRCSSLTGCSPLHVALRNYGSCTELIQFLLEKDEDGSVISHINYFGDSPLHVACSVGVPMKVLRLVIEHSLAAMSINGRVRIWNANYSGYTPVDLEWIRHIESGKGIYAPRVFDPMETTGVPIEMRKHDPFHQVLLQRAVDQVMLERSDTRRHTFMSEKVMASGRKQSAETTFGMLLHRIFLVIKGAAGCEPLSLDSSQHLLHAACSLCAPSGPSLPLPIIRLFLALYPDQVSERDERCGRLPLHYAVEVPPKTSYYTPTAGEVERALDWESAVLQMLAKAPHTSGIKDNSGRLPLHVALDAPKEGSASSLAARQARDAVVKSLVKANPESVLQPDPVSHLCPFLQAASSPHVSLDVTFFLLRRSPCVFVSVGLSI